MSTTEGKGNFLGYDSKIALTRGIMPPAVEQAIIAAELPVMAEDYTPTIGEVKLLRVIFDAAFQGSEPGPTDITRMAGVAPSVYYDACKKKGFIDTIRLFAMEPIKAKAPQYISWLEKYASKGSWKHLQALLAIGNLYDEKMGGDENPIHIVVRPGSPQPFDGE